MSKVSLPVSTDLSNNFKSIILQTHFSWDYFREEQQKYLQSSQNNAAYHPMNPDTDVTCQKFNLFSSDKCLICLISDVPHYIWNQHSTVNTILVKVVIVGTCGAMPCSYFGTHFCYFLWR